MGGDDLKQCSVGSMMSMFHPDPSASNLTTGIGEEMVSCKQARRPRPMAIFVASRVLIVLSWAACAKSAKLITRHVQV